MYDATPRPDDKSEYLKSRSEAAGATWRRIVGMPNDAVAQMVRGDSLDVLVELTGHTANNRLAVMCYKPAPVQMTWIGYPNSTGLQAVDYRCCCRYIVLSPVLQLHSAVTCRWSHVQFRQTQQVHAHMSAADRAFNVNMP